jgi:hypothetical protein
MKQDQNRPVSVLRQVLEVKSVYADSMIKSLRSCAEIVALGLVLSD